MATRRPITFTLDLEDHRPSSEAPVRFPEVTRAILDWLDELGARGTVFVVGEDAAAQPELIREVAGRGHELALHAWQHRPLTELSPHELRADIDRGKALVEDLSGAPVTGFRAPMFSLVPESRWATDVVADAGFAYSSSVMPARNPLFGDPTCSAAPFRWPNGLLELPCPVARVGPVGLPYLGGVYVRTLPLPLVRSLLAAQGGGELPWIYCHPYDFDPGEQYWDVPEVGRVGNRLLWYNRKRLFTKLGRVLRDRAGAPLGERIAELSIEAPA
jgi:polysaccharide deacetylase family protein (PEP-CTERM system associated)